MLVRPLGFGLLVPAFAGNHAATCILKTAFSLVTGFSVAVEWALGKRILRKHLYLHLPVLAGCSRQVAAKKRLQLFLAKQCATSFESSRPFRIRGQAAF